MNFIGLRSNCKRRSCARYAVQSHCDVDRAAGREADFRPRRCGILLLGNLSRSPLPLRGGSAQDLARWSSNCAKPRGSPRPTWTPRRSVNSTTSPRAGSSPAASWPCATRERAPQGSREKLNNTSCSKPASISSIECSSPTSASRWRTWPGSTTRGRARKT